MIEKIRGGGGNVLLFDTGNCLSGRPLVEMTGGEAMTRCMSMMDYDAMALGDADFDIGWQAIESLMKETDFPILSANLIRGDAETPQYFAEPYTIIEIENEGTGVKIGVIGLSYAAEFGKLSSEKIDDIRALDPIESLEPVLEEVSEITRRIIVLSNLTRTEDVAVATAYPEIDLIIGSKSPLFQMAPVFVHNGETSSLESEGDDLGEGTLIVSGIDKGRGLGVLGVRLDSDGDILRFRYEQVSIRPEDHEEDPEMAAFLFTYENTLRKPDAREALEEWDRITEGDYSHLRNLESVLALGEKGRHEFESGNYSLALELLETAKDSLLMREQAREEQKKFEEEFARGTPEGLKTDKLMNILEGAKQHFRDRQYAKAKQQFKRATWNLKRMHRLDFLLDEYRENKDLLKEDGIDLTMSDEQRERLETAIDEEDWGAALSVLQGVTLKITRGRNIRRWRKITDSLIEELGNEVFSDTLVERTFQEAESLYFSGSFPKARVKYLKLSRLLEPLLEKDETASPEPYSEPRKPGNSYVGSQSCRECHGRQYEQWETTLHMRAYAHLEEQARRDSSCVGCHVVGFGSEDGFKIDDPDPRLAEVGCESCHGRGLLHTRTSDPSLILDGYDRMNCRRCHDPSQGFSFDYYPALIRVMHQ